MANISEKLRKILDDAREEIRQSKKSGGRIGGSIVRSPRYLWPAGPSDWALETLDLGLEEGTLTKDPEEET